MHAITYFIYILCLRNVLSFLQLLQLKVLICNHNEITCQIFKFIWLHPLIRLIFYNSYISKIWNIIIFLFRSEKLYVTEDIRSDRPKSSRGKCICATLGILLVCAAITVAVLIGGNFMILYAFIFLMVNFKWFWS